MDITMEGVLTLVASITGADKEDLVTSTNDKEITTIEELRTAIKPIISEHSKKFNEQLEKKAHRKTLAKAERRIKEVFPDLESNKLDDIVVELQTKVNKPAKTEKTEIKEADIQRYLATDKGKEYIQTANEEYAETKINKLNFEKDITDAAVAALEQQGGQFSKNPTIRKRQIATLQRELLSSHKFNKQGDKFVPVDDEGNELFDPSTKKISKFLDVVTSLSPVDIVTDTKPSVNQPAIPSAKGILDNANANNFGFSSEQLKSIGADDYNKAVAAGDLEKQAFISKQLQARAEAEQNK